MMRRRNFCISISAAVLANAPLMRAQAKEKIVGIDCHAHVFTRELTFVKERRYTPDYDATIPAYLAMLAANKMSHGVLVQPSFLGTDNSFLLSALRTAPENLRGIAVLETSISTAELRDLDRQGFVGIRLNMIGNPTPAFDRGEWPDHLARILDLNWQVEIYAESKRLPALLPPLLEKGAKVVVDHFGLPDQTTGVDDPGFRFLLSTGKTRHVWVKLSGAYRSGPNGEQIARAAYPLLRDALGLDHLVWGSDWPHTQFEKVMTPTRAKAFFDSLVVDQKERQMILTRTPAKLYRFSV